MNTNKIVLKNAINAYINSLKLKKTKSPGTVKVYESHLKDFAKFLGNKPLNQIFLRDIESYQAVLNDAGLSNSTIAYRLITIRSFLKWAKRQGLNVLDRDQIELPKVIREPLTIPSDEEITRLLENTDCRTKRGLLTRTILELLISSGLRVHELISLEVSKLDMVNCKVTVVGKGNKIRLVFFSQKARDYLTKYQICRKKKDSPFLFPISIRTVERLLKEHGQKLGIEFHPHMARHYFATKLLHNGTSIYAVSKMLGHSSVSTTEIYLHHEDGDLAAAHRQVFDSSLISQSNL